MDINSTDTDCGYWKLKLRASQMMVYRGMDYFINFCILALWKSSQNGIALKTFFIYIHFLHVWSTAFLVIISCDYNNFIAMDVEQAY